MKQWDSLLRLVVLGLLMLTMLSCGESELGGTRDTSTPRVLSTPTAISLPPDASVAARIRARGHLLVGVRYDDDPFGMVNDQGDLVGFDVDLAREFAARWLGATDAVRFVQVTNASVNERIRMGQVDLIIGALSRNKNAARDMVFSTPYYYDGLSLLVRTTRPVTETTVINAPSDLSDESVGVVDGEDTEAPLLRAAGAAMPKIVNYPDYFSAVAGLETQVVEAVVGPRRTLERLTSGSGGLGLTPRFTRDAYAIGIPKDDGPFRDLANVTLMSIIRDGTYGRLFEQWFPEESPPELEIWTGTSHLSFADLSETLAPAPSTIGDIEEGGYLVVGLLDDRLPFGDFDANGLAQGFEAELARTFAGRWLDDVTAVQFVRHTEESGIAALKVGEIDLLLAHLPHSLPLDDEIDFSQTIYQGGLGLLVSAASGIDSLAGINGGTVAVAADGTTAEAVQKATTQAGIVVSVQTVDDVNAALAGVEEGRYRAYAHWRVELLNLAYTNAGFVVLDERLTQRPIALGVRQNDAPFRDLVNFTLQELAAEGRYAALYDDWFGTDPPFALEVWPGAPYLALKLKRPPVIVPTATP